MTKSRSKLGPWPTLDQSLENGSIVHWSHAFRGRNSVMFVPVTCGRCLKKRTIDATNTRGKRGRAFAGLCQRCASTIKFAKSGPDHPSWRGGRFKSGGYWYFWLPALSSRAREIADQMPRKGWNSHYAVAEHRLIMALQLDRPLAAYEVVHHRNGNKEDNRPENLELTTHGDHRKLDVKYYQLWQEALAKIAELESELVRCRNNNG